MKKLIIASAIAMSFMGTVNTASAANGDVQFIGSVSGTTCDLVPEVGGAVNKVVQLGTVTPSTAGTAVDFTLKPAAGTTCTGIDSKTASIAWTGQFDGQGLTAQSGTATDAWVKLVAKNSKTADKPMVQGDVSAEFEGAKFNTTGEGAKFSAQLNGGTIAGNYLSAAAFVVSYK